MPIKPLGHKSYGSIPHLPGSRLGPGDHHCHSGQAKIATQKARDKHDFIIIQEKLDGSNVGVAKLNGQILPLTRAGYLATTSPYVQHHYFAAWVEQNRRRFHDTLNEGERICGEWLAQAHGTKYRLRHEPFVAFDLMAGKDRLSYGQMLDRVYPNFVTPVIIGYGPMAVDDVVLLMGSGGHGAIDKVEGAVWRVERKGKVDFLTKFVHHDKEDGKYLPEKNGTGAEIWNVNVSLFNVSI